MSRDSRLLLPLLGAIVLAAGTAALFAAAATGDSTATLASALAQRVVNAAPSEIEADPALHGFVKTTAEHAIGRYCASCHGADLKGRAGVPDLTGDQLLWGTGALEEIDATQVMSLQQTLLWGIRDQNCPDSERKRQYGACPDTRYSHMPAYVKDKVYSTRQIADLAEYVLHLSKQQFDAAAAARGKTLYAKGCVECHGQDGFGYPPYGGPNLTDDVWLYGGSRSAIVNSLSNGPGSGGNGGVCPPWSHKLDAATIKALAIYIHGRQNELY